MLAHALLNELFNVFPILFRVKVCVGADIKVIKHDNFQYFSIKSYVDDRYYTPNGYIVPMEFRVHFFPRISAFSRRTKMHLNGILLIGNEFFKIIVSL